MLAEPLNIIYNISLKICKVPNAWKLATVTAIFKNKGNKHDPSNYRPISLTSIACRVLESIIRDSVMDYLKANSILSDKQFGFLGGRSTILQLLTAMDNWTEALDRGGAIDVIYCDFQKAFDTVAHNRLMKLLCHYGIKDPILSWIEDYLKDRKQQVSVNGSKSNLFDVPSGVPQGSVLGPLLFIIYINSMVKKAADANIYLYADDLKLYQEIKTDEDVEKLQNDLDKLYDWTQYSLLKFHPTKCVVMRLMSSKCKVLRPRGIYDMDERKLNEVSEEKDLGITFNGELTFEKHINEKVNKANALVGMLRRSFVHLDKDIFKLLFISIVRPHLEYGAPVWNPHTQKLINQIENVQRRASKLIPGMFNLSYRERLEMIKLPTLVYRRYRGDMIEVYKLSHDFYDKSAMKNLLDFEDHSQNYDMRGHPFKISKLKCKKDVRRYYFKLRVSEQWNNLPTHVVTARSLNTFKNRLDKIWGKNGEMYDPDINLYDTTSARRTRYITVTDEED